MRFFLNKLVCLDYWTFYLATSGKANYNFFKTTVKKYELFPYKEENCLSLLFLKNLFLFNFQTFNFLFWFEFFVLELILKQKKFFFIKLDELELKGINYWFTKLWNTVLLDLGCSHFQLLTYSLIRFFISLKKKKFKKILFINFNKSFFFSTVNFFWYQLKGVGPYKLKGFQFINEWIKLKEGKKPFK